MLGLHLESRRVDEKARFPIAPQLLEMLIERPRIIDIRGAQGHIPLGGKGAPIHAKAAVAAFVRAETFKEEDILRHGNHRIAGHEEPPQLHVVLHQIIGVFLPCIPIDAAKFLKPRHQALWNQFRLSCQDLLFRFPVAALANLRLPFLLFLPVCLISALVLWMVAPIANDYVVESTDGLAETKRLPQGTDETHPIAAQVRRQRNGQTSGTRHDGASLPVGQGEVHDIRTQLI